MSNSQITVCIILSCIHLQKKGEKISTQREINSQTGAGSHRSLAGAGSWI